MQNTLNKRLTKKIAAVSVRSKEIDIRYWFEGFSMRSEIWSDRLGRYLCFSEIKPATRILVLLAFTRHLLWEGI